MQNDLLYLSDIYIENESSIIKSKTNTSIKNLYRFEFSLPLQTTEHPTSAATTDADGDLVVHRLQTNKHTFHIESELKTSLVDVGLQLWRASFFLADFLIHNSSLIRDESVLDLGAGLGITSLVASLFAKHVYCTDLDHVVKYASMNYRRNAEVIKEINPNSCVDFKCLDWANYHDLLVDKNTSDFSLTEADLSGLKKTTVLLAADVVYDHIITFYFMNVLYKLLTEFHETSKKTCYISNEKRINFNADEMSVSDTAHDYFQECLNDLDDYVDEELQVRFKVTRIACDLEDLPQYICSYKRNKFLSIWKIESFKINNHSVEHTGSSNV